MFDSVSTSVSHPAGPGQAGPDSSVLQTSRLVSRPSTASRPTHVHRTYLQEGERGRCNRYHWVTANTHSQCLYLDAVLCNTASCKSSIALGAVITLQTEHSPLSCTHTTRCSYLKPEHQQRSDPNSLSHSITLSQIIHLALRSLEMLSHRFCSPGGLCWTSQHICTDPCSPPVPRSPSVQA